VVDLGEDRHDHHHEDDHGGDQHGGDDHQHEHQDGGQGNNHDIAKAKEMSRKATARAAAAVKKKKEKTNKRKEKATKAAAKGGCTWCSGTVKSREKKRESARTAVEKKRQSKIMSYTGARIIEKLDKMVNETGYQAFVYHKLMRWIPDDPKDCTGRCTTMKQLEKKLKSEGKKLKHYDVKFADLNGPTWRQWAKLAERGGLRTAGFMFWGGIKKYFNKGTYEGCIDESVIDPSNKNGYPKCNNRRWKYRSSIQRSGLVAPFLCDHSKKDGNTFKMREFFQSKEPNVPHTAHPDYWGAHFFNTAECATCQVSTCLKVDGKSHVEPPFEVDRRQTRGVSKKSVNIKTFPFGKLDAYIKIQTHKGNAWGVAMRVKDVVIGKENLPRGAKVVTSVGLTKLNWSPRTGGPYYLRVDDKHGMWRLNLSTVCGPRQKITICPKGEDNKRKKCGVYKYCKGPSDPRVWQVHYMPFGSNYLKPGLPGVTANSVHPSLRNKKSFKPGWGAEARKHIPKHIHGIRGFGMTICNTRRPQFKHRKAAGKRHCLAVQRGPRKKLIEMLLQHPSVTKAFQDICSEKCGFF
jgi:hypothetical protein